MTGEKSRKDYCHNNPSSECSREFSSNIVREAPFLTGDRGRLMKMVLVTLYDIPHRSPERLFACKSRVLAKMQRRDRLLFAEKKKANGNLQEL